MATMYSPPDFKITVDKFTWNVHQSVLVENSTFFKLMCKSSLKESQTHEVTLHDDNPVHVAQMIIFMYYGEYPTRRAEEDPYGSHVCLDMLDASFHGDECQEALEAVFKAVECDDSPESEGRLKSHFMLYTIADKYGIRGLDNHSVNRMLEEVIIWDGNMYKIWLIVEFMETTNISTKVMKELLIPSFVDNIDSYKGDSRFDAMVRIHSDLALGIIKGLAGQISDLLHR